MRYFLRSVGFAMEGIFRFFQTERNGRIQGAMALVVVGLGLFLRIDRSEWLAILFCIGLVISLEMINSAIERICNRQTVEFDPAIKSIKDVAAAAVLWASLVAALIGVVIFAPRVMAFFH